MNLDDDRTTTLGDTDATFTPLNSDDDSEEVGAPNTAFARKRGFFKQFLATNGPPQILSVALLASIGYGAIFGILPKLMVQRFAELNHGYTGQDCEDFDSEADKPKACLLGSDDSQNAHSLSELVANLLTIFTGSIIGDITDTRGRKELFVLATVFALLSNFGFVYVYLNSKASPWIFYGLRACHGLVSWNVIAMASAADAVPPDLRAPGTSVNMLPKKVIRSLTYPLPTVVGLVLSGFLGGLCIGPIFAVVIGRSNAVAFASVLAVSAIVVALFVPETLKPEIAAEARRQKEASRSGDRSTMGSIRYHLLSPFKGLSILTRNSLFRILSVLAFFTGMVGAGDKILLLYYVDSELAFTERDTALMFLLYGMGVVIGQGMLVKPLVDRLGEKRLTLLCFVFAVFSNLAYGLATNKMTIFVGIGLGAISGIAFPIIAAIQANNVDASEQGKMQGALCSLSAVATGIGPVAMRYVDYLASGGFFGAGAMFIFGALLQLVATAFAFSLPRHLTDSKYLNRADSDIDQDPEEEQMVPRAFD